MITFLDIETTHLRSDIGEIARIDFGKISASGEFELKRWIISPKSSVPPSFFKSSKIQASELEAAPQLGDVIDDINDNLENNLVICYNADFVRQFFEPLQIAGILCFEFTLMGLEEMYPEQFAVSQEIDFLGNIRKKFNFSDEASDVELLHKYVGGLLA